MKFVRLRYAVVVCVLPQAKRSEDRVAPINLAIAVAAAFRFVIFSQREKAISLYASGRCRLESKVTKQFGSVVYRAITVSVQNKPCIVARRNSPCNSFRSAVTIKVEIYSRRAVGQIESVAKDVEQDWTRSVTPTGGVTRIRWAALAMWVPAEINRTDAIRRTFAPVVGTIRGA